MRSIRDHPGDAGDQPISKSRAHNAASPSQSVTRQTTQRTPNLSLLKLTNARATSLKDTDSKKREKRVKDSESSEAGSKDE